MSCHCLPEPLAFAVPAPPDPSLIWHLLTDEKFEKADDCEWNPFLSISDISSNGSLSPVAHRALIGTSLVAVLFLFLLLISMFWKMRRRRTASKSKASSSDAIMSCGDNVWTYNSMKHSHNGPLMYSGSHGGSRMIGQATPATMRSYVLGLEAGQFSNSQATTLRLHPHESTAAYHTVNPPRGGGPPTDYYEEIPARGALPPNCYIQPTFSPPMTSIGRMSIRKPPPSCRPPPPPNQYSPTGSDCSVERELQRVPTESPPGPLHLNWDEGRESGYGTAPSRLWKSPQSNQSNQTKSDDSTYVLPQNAVPHSMTYV